MKKKSQKKVDDGLSGIPVRKETPMTVKDVTAALLKAAQSRGLKPRGDKDGKKKKATS